MNTILDEMGAKWNTISTAQQVSVAQTVAGVRQYTQLISLMENWDKVQTNVTLAETSSGELERQQEIYAESWEAAAERVGAAAEAIYQSLLDDEAFVDIMDFFADFLRIIDKAIDGLGGLPGVLSLVGTALMRAFSP
jgi:TP901 family phage tail tape measure protein